MTQGQADIGRWRAIESIAGTGINVGRVVGNLVGEESAVVIGGRGQGFGDEERGYRPAGIVAAIGRAVEDVICGGTVTDNVRQVSRGTAEAEDCPGSVLREVDGRCVPWIKAGGNA